MKPAYLIAGIGAALLIIFALQYRFGSADDAGADGPSDDRSAAELADELGSHGQNVAPIPPALPARVQINDLPQGSSEQTQEPVLPSLDDSDPLARELSADFDFPADWLAKDQLLRRMATVLDNASQGTYPQRQLAFMIPKEAFKVRVEGNKYFLDPTGYRRFDYLPTMLERVPAATLAGYIQQLRPLLVQGLQELGQQGSPEQLLRAALDEIREVPVLQGDIELVRPEVVYRFRDDELESRSVLQKQMLRMGPANVTRVQRYLEDLALALDI